MHPEDCAVERRDGPFEECMRSLAGNAAGEDVSACKHMCSIKEEASEVMV